MPAPGHLIFACKYVCARAKNRLYTLIHIEDTKLLKTNFLHQKSYSRSNQFFCRSIHNPGILYARTYTQALGILCLQHDVISSHWAPSWSILMISWAVYSEVFEPNYYLIVSFRLYGSIGSEIKNR